MEKELYVICSSCNEKFYAEKISKEKNEWQKGKGDKDLWDKWAYFQYVSNGKIVSEPFLIASIYCNPRIKDEISVNGMRGGSWPICKKTEKEDILQVNGGNGITHLLLTSRPKPK